MTKKKAIRNFRRENENFSPQKRHSEILGPPKKMSRPPQTRRQVSATVYKLVVFTLHYIRGRGSSGRKIRGTDLASRSNISLSSPSLARRRRLLN